MDNIYLAEYIHFCLHFFVCLYLRPVTLTVTITFYNMSVLKKSIFYHSDSDTEWLVPTVEHSA